MPLSNQIKEFEIDPAEIMFWLSNAGPGRVMMTERLLDGEVIMGCVVAIHPEIRRISVWVNRQETIQKENA